MARGNPKRLEMYRPSGRFSRNWRVLSTQRVNLSGSRPKQIEVGADDDDGTIDLWIAKESVRQGELLLSNQVNLRSMYNTSAISLLGWSVTLSIALLGWLIVKLASIDSSGAVDIKPFNVVITALLTFSSIFISGCFCIWSLLPRRGTKLELSGIPPRSLLNGELRTELENLDAIAQAYVNATEKNLAFLERFRLRLRIAWFLFLFSPLFGLLSYVVTLDRVRQLLVQLR